MTSIVFSVFIYV